MIFPFNADSIADDGKAFSGQSDEKKIYDRRRGNEIFETKKKRSGGAGEKKFGFRLFKVY